MDVYPIVMYNEEQVVPVKPFTMEEFNAMDKTHQQYALASLEGMDLTEMIPLLAEIAERDDVAPIVISFAVSATSSSGAYAEEVNDP